MDDFFNTINVRDLLSTPDIDDPSSQLSAPDLRLLIDRLDSHSHHIKSKVQSYILSNRANFSDLLSLSSSSFSQSLSLSSNLQSLISILSPDDDCFSQIESVLKEIRIGVSDLEVTKNELSILKVIVRLSERLRELKELIRVGDFVVAAKGIRALKGELRIGSVDEERENEKIFVYGLLRKELMNSFEEIQDLLVKFMDNAVRFDPQIGRIRVVYCPDVGEAHRVQLPAIFEAMDVLGILDYGLARTADLFIKHAIAPAVNVKAPVSFLEESTGSLEESGDAILKIVPNSETKIEGLDCNALFSRMTEVVKFIYQHVCLENGHWTRCFGRLTWPRMSELIISNFFSKVVPDDASKLADFQKIMNSSAEFETALKEFMFISESDKNDERLSNFADNVELHFAVRKKTELLANVRQLIIRCDFTIPEELGYKGPNAENTRNSDCVISLLFSSERCIVSNAACQLMKLVNQTLQDVCLSSPRVALEFYHAARDVLLLYEAIIPIKLERQRDSINQAAVLMHNDCLFLSQEILGLAFEYRPDFPSLLKEHAIFVDIAPRLQLLAENILHQHIQITISNLREAIDGADGFQNTHQMPQYESTKFSLERVIFILEKIRILWEPVLLPSTYKKSMCMVLESVFSRITQDILLLDDIDAEETLQLQRLIQLLLGSLSPLLEALSTVSFDKKSDNSFSRPLEADIPSLGKIRKLSELLDMSLKSITEAWECGDLYGCGFVLTEVVDFIKAIFTDSSLRRDCLARIYRINF
ncbi:centromere/kinetochore protein zw10 homolog [Amaranthus tricolor]|uniref:centromere/kinetochore protein zw10 homolog n=1 Tax=Amaranthus tricolor TaxID=29722 RepID=UPI00258E98B1|nr:centromere/kinetochore protein zw10 homolog [Amaranthus tricolor]